MSKAGIKTLILEDYYDNTKKSQYKIQSFMDLSQDYDANNDIINVCEFINGDEEGYISEEAAHSAGQVVELKEYSLSTLIEEHRERGVYLNVYVTDGDATISLLMSGLPYWNVNFDFGGSLPAGWTDVYTRTGFVTKLENSVTSGNGGGQPTFYQNIQFTQGKFYETAFTVETDIIVQDTYLYLYSVLWGGANLGYSTANDLNITAMTINTPVTYTAGMMLFNDIAFNAQQVGVNIENWGGVTSAEATITVTNVTYTEHDVVPDAYGFGWNFINGNYATPDTLDKHANHTITYNATTGQLEIAYSGAGTTNITWTKTAGITGSGFTGQAYIKCSPMVSGESVSGVRFDGASTYNVVAGTLATANAANGGLGLDAHASSQMNSGGAEYGIQIITPAGTGTIYIDKYNFSWDKAYLT
jgi:hypothetical protein